MRISTPDKRIWEYAVGDAVEVDVSYQSRSSFKRLQRPAQWHTGTVTADTKQAITVMVGSGTKVHDASGLQVTIDAPGKNYGGAHWFGVSPRCQEYRGKGHNWMQVSPARVIEDATVTCSKCRP
jgi:ribosomal protein L21E